MNGGELLVVADGPAVLRLFELAGVSDFLSPTPDLALPGGNTKPKIKASWPATDSAPSYRGNRPLLRAVALRTSSGRPCLCACGSRLRNRLPRCLRHPNALSSWAADCRDDGNRLGCRRQGEKKAVWVRLPTLTDLSAQ